MQNNEKIQLEAVNIEKAFSGLSVLNKVSLKVKKGEVLAIIGKSGSGKSTLLRCLNHLETVEKGSIYIDGEAMVITDSTGKANYSDKKALRNICLKMGFVFQDYNLFPHMTVLRNLTESMRYVLNIKKEDAEKQAILLLKQVGLDDKINQYPGQLSGGQCQRVAIARALALNPEILCFDEPTSALDPQLTQEVLSVIRKLSQENRTMIVVTHEMNFAKEVADRIIFMEDGIIAEEGTPDALFGKTRSEKLKSFMGIIGEVN